MIDVDELIAAVNGTPTESSYATRRRAFLNKDRILQDKHDKLLNEIESFKVALNENIKYHQERIQSEQSALRIISSDLRALREASTLCLSTIARYKKEISTLEASLTNARRNEADLEAKALDITATIEDARDDLNNAAIPYEPKIRSLESKLAKIKRRLDSHRHRNKGLVSGA